MIFDKDETNRPETTIETLAKLKPAFRKDGAITAGNAPGLNSGAAAMIVAERAFAEKRGLKPLARLLSFGVAGRAGDVRHRAGTGGAARAGACELEGVRRAAHRDQRGVRRDRACCLRELEFAEDVVNVEGGSIAHGHAIGATGAVLTTRLLHSMKRDGLERGVVTLCIGGGQGIALASRRSDVLGPCRRTSSRKGKAS